MKHLQDKEIKLHKFSYRTDEKILRELLHPNFTEIGYSGNTYNIEEIIRSLNSETEPNYLIVSKNYYFDELSSEIVRVTYLQARQDSEDNLSRFSKRTSIWVKEKTWKLKFHQATPISTY